MTQVVIPIDKIEIQSGCGLNILLCAVIHFAVTKFKEDGKASTSQVATAYLGSKTHPSHRWMVRRLGDIFYRNSLQDKRLPKKIGLAYAYPINEWRDLLTKRNTQRLTFFEPIRQVLMRVGHRNKDKMEERAWPSDIAGFSNTIYSLGTRRLCKLLEAIEKRLVGEEGSAPVKDSYAKKIMALTLGDILEWARLSAMSMDGFPTPEPLPKTAQPEGVQEEDTREEAVRNEPVRNDTTRDQTGKEETPKASDQEHHDQEADKGVATETGVEAREDVQKLPTEPLPTARHFYLLTAAVCILALGNIIAQLLPPTIPAPVSTAAAVAQPVMQPEPEPLGLKTPAVMPDLGDPGPEEEPERAPTIPELSAVAFTAITNGEYDVAEQNINAMRSHPEIDYYYKGESWLLDGKLMRRLGNFRTAAVSFLRAYEAYAKHPGTDAHQMMARSESAKMETLNGQPDLAIKTLEECFIPSVRDESAVHTWYGALSEAYMTAGDYKRSLEVSEKRLSLTHEKNPSVLTDIAFGHILNGNAEKASQVMAKVELYQGVPTKQQWMWKILYNIASLRLSGQDHSGEVSALEELLKEAPDRQLEHFLKIATSFEINNSLH